MSKVTIADSEILIRVYVEVQENIGPLIPLSNITINEASSYNLLTNCITFKIWVNIMKKVICLYQFLILFSLDVVLSLIVQGVILEAVTTGFTTISVQAKQSIDVIIY